MRRARLVGKAGESALRTKLPFAACARFALRSREARKWGGKRSFAMGAHSTWAIAKAAVLMQERIIFAATRRKCLDLHESGRPPRLRSNRMHPEGEASQNQANRQPRRRGNSAVPRLYRVIYRFWLFAGTNPGRSLMAQSALSGSGGD